MKLFSADRIIGHPEADFIAVEEGVITEIGSGHRSAITRLGHALSPGFVDIQINGFGDVMFDDASAGDMVRVASRLASRGTTTIVPTFLSAPFDSYDRKLSACADAVALSRHVVGAHLEGPFLGSLPGAHNAALICDVDLSLLSRAVSSGVLLMTTLAPEADPGAAGTKLLASAGVCVSLGHSGCSFDDAVSFADAGARAVTHTFNAMAPIHGRDVGLAGAALTLPGLIPMFIADLIHVSEAALRLSLAARSDAVIVSDAIGIDSSACSEAGVTVDGGVPKLRSGTIAGSITTLDGTLKNLVSIGLDLELVVAMMTTHPARLLGLAGRGQIAVGSVADLVVLSAAGEVESVLLAEAI